MPLTSYQANVIHVFCYICHYLLLLNNKNKNNITVKQASLTALNISEHFMHYVFFTAWINVFSVPAPFWVYVHTLWLFLLSYI